MRILSALWVFGAVAFGQAQQRVFTLPADSTPQNFQEMVNAIRTIAYVEPISQDSNAKTVTVRGTADQFALADWLLNQLQTPGSGTQSYTVPGVVDDTQNLTIGSQVRVFYVPEVQTQLTLQELVNAIRTIADISQVYQVQKVHAIAIRTHPEMAALAEWLVKGLKTSGSGKQQYTIPGLADDGLRPGLSQVRIFYTTETQNQQSLQELVNAIRTVTDIPKIYQVLKVRAIALRSTADGASLAEWIIGRLDRPAGSQAATAQFTASGVYPPDSTAARVFYLPEVTTLEALQQTTNNLRSAVQTRKIYPAFFPRAIVLRGTAGDATIAENLVAKQ